MGVSDKAETWAEEQPEERAQGGGVSARVFEIGNHCDVQTSPCLGNLEWSGIEHFRNAVQPPLNQTSPHAWGCQALRLAARIANGFPMKRTEPSISLSASRRGKSISYLVEQRVRGGLRAWTWNFKAGLIGGWGLEESPRSSGEPSTGEVEGAQSIAADDSTLWKHGSIPTGLGGDGGFRFVVP